MPTNQTTKEAKPYLLLIEDDLAIGQMYLKKLTQEGYSVRWEKDGEQGFKALTQGQRPEVLLLDIVVPKKDGYEILKDLRKDPALHTLKVIMLTNLTQDADVKEAEKLEADAYLVKAHIAPKDLIEEIEKLRNT